MIDMSIVIDTSTMIDTSAVIETSTVGSTRVAFSSISEKLEKIVTYK